MAIIYYICIYVFTSPNVCHLGAPVDYICVCVCVFFHKILSVYTTHIYNIKIINSSVVYSIAARERQTRGI